MKTDGYIIEVTDAENRRFYPIEGAEIIGKTTIERNDSLNMFRGYQTVYHTKADAEMHIDRIRILAEAKGERSTMPDRPTLPVTVAAVPYTFTTKTRHKAS